MWVLEYRVEAVLLFKVGKFLKEIMVSSISKTHTHQKISLITVLASTEWLYKKNRALYYNSSFFVQESRLGFFSRLGLKLEHLFVGFFDFLNSDWVDQK